MTSCLQITALWRPRSGGSAKLLARGAVVHNIGSGAKSVVRPDAAAWRQTSSPSSTAPGIGRGRERGPKLGAEALRDQDSARSTNRPATARSPSTPPEHTHGANRICTDALIARVALASTTSGYCRMTLSGKARAPVVRCAGQVSGDVGWRTCLRRSVAGAGVFGRRSAAPAPNEPCPPKRGHSRLGPTRRLCHV
jgi:hypothetical protein